MDKISEIIRRDIVDIIKNGLKVMDTSACALCRQNNIPIVVFDFEAQDGIVDILNGKEVGTLIK